ncbi:hypothetical protein ACH4TQ_49530 [Streptomyces sp. NPDC021218]|uniref:hypothetical protein n=1 Tax=Streptomyces sp. NPDC021218 TaxID=3365119 RepID=UPI0037B6B6F3
MDYRTGSHRLTNRKDTWSARCGESRTPGAASGTGKRAGGNTGTAPCADSTGRFYRSALYPLLERINSYLVRWIRKKYERFAALRKAVRRMQMIAKWYPGMFAHWRWVSSAASAW